MGQESVTFRNGMYKLFQTVNNSNQRRLMLQEGRQKGLSGPMVFGYAKDVHI